MTVARVNLVDSMEKRMNNYPDDSDPDGDEVDAAGTFKGITQ